MTYLVEIDEDACAAHGDCVEVAPNVFALGDIAEIIGSGTDEELLAAAEACPSTAIRVIDADSSAQVYP
jgi:ferredoxin